MGTFIAEIDNYWVGTYRSSRGAPFGMHLITRRTIKLNLKPGGYGNGLLQANLYFADNDVYDANFRDYSGFRRSETSLDGFLPLIDFQDYYKILQTESPVHFLWHELERDDRLNTVQVLQITTFDEPLGEGPSELNA